MLDMPERCPVCNQKYELETGFWYGTGYVSYGITVGLSVFTFILWWILIGFSVDDNRIFYWLIANGILVIVLQPWLMRLSRVVYLWFFVKYSDNYERENPKLFT